MRRQFVRFNIPTDDLRLLTEFTFAFEENNLDATIETLEKACSEVEMGVKSIVEGFIKKMNDETTNDEIITLLTECAEIMFERNNWGRVIVFISFVGTSSCIL
jgi:hypothetical protein